MFRRIALFAILLSALPAFSASLRDTLNLEWMQKSYSSIETVLNKGDQISVIPVVNTLIEIWVNRDGGVSGEVSPLIVTALINNTEPTLIILSEYPDSFVDWLDELDGIVFTDFTGSESEHLEQVKAKLIESLRKYSKDGKPELLPLTQRLIERLESISIQTVD